VRPVRLMLRMAGEQTDEQRAVHHAHVDQHLRLMQHKLLSRLDGHGMLIVTLDNASDMHDSNVARLQQQQQQLQQLQQPRHCCACRTRCPT